MKPEYIAEIVAASNRVDGGTVAVRRTPGKY